MSGHRRDYKETGDKFVDDVVEHILRHPTVKETQQLVFDSIEEGKSRLRCQMAEVVQIHPQSLVCMGKCSARFKNLEEMDFHNKQTGHPVIWLSNKPWDGVSLIHIGNVPPANLDSYGDHVTWRGRITS